MFEEALAKFNRWHKDRLPFKMGEVSRRSALFGAIASIALIGPAQAILFSGASVSSPAPGALTTLTLKTISGSNIAANQPFQFGLPIAPATMATTSKVTCTDASSNTLTVQEDNRVVDADGYVRWVMITTILVTAPGAASTSISIGTTAGTPDTSNPITLANLLAQTISADTFECQNQITMPNGDVYTALATTGLNASTWTYGSAFFEGYWRQGPLCTEFVVLMPYVKSGTPHDYLYVEMHIAAYKNTNAAWNNSTNPITGVKAYCFNENGFNGNSAGWTGTPQDYAYDWSIKMGASTLSTALSLTGGAGSGTLTLSATVGQTDVSRSSGTWALSTTTPNSSDSGKAIYQISTAKIAYLQKFNSATNMGLSIPVAWTGTSIGAADWKTLGVYHYFASRVSNTNPVIGGSWWGANHDLVYPILTSAYLKASQMLPNYRLTSADIVAPNMTQCDGDGAHPCGMQQGGIKNYGTAEQAAGDQEYIGVFTDQQANAIVNWDSSSRHPNARKLILYNAEVGHRKPFWIRNEDYGQVNTIADMGVYSMNNGDDGNSPPINYYRLGTTWFQFAGNHSGQVSQFPYIVTGDLYHLQNSKMLAGQYSIQGDSYTIYNTTNFAFSISGATITTSINPFQGITGDTMSIRSTGALPQVSGVTIPGQNRYYYRAVTVNTGNLYDTLAHCLAGGATGKVTFSSSGSSLYFLNGFNRATRKIIGDIQTRTTAWTARSRGQNLVLWPSNPITPGLITYGDTKAQFQRDFSNLMTFWNSIYTTNALYNAGAQPRWLTVQNGTNSGAWQLNYVRQTCLNLLESGAQAAVGSLLANWLDWQMADAIQWHIETSIWPPLYCSSYYVYVQNNLTSGTAPANQNFLDIYKAQIGSPWGTSQGGSAYGRFYPSNRTCTVGSVADPANVTITLSGNWFTTADKADYENNSMFATMATYQGAYTGYGRIKSISSPTVFVVDFTVTSQYGLSLTPIVPTAGAGQYVGLPFPPVSVAAAQVTAVDIAYVGGNNGSGTVDGTYAMMDRSSLEISKQRGINVGTANANYTAAVSEMTNRSFPTSWSGASSYEVKFNLLSRV